VGGPSSADELARRTGLHRTTVYRLLDTLQGDGFVKRDEESGRYAPTAQVRQLSDGLTVRDAASQAALPAMFALTNAIKWPSDLGVFDAGAVVIRESTHPFSPLSVHRALVGRRRLFLNSALGRAILAAASPELRGDMIGIAAASDYPDARLAKDSSAVQKLVGKVHRDGYASSINDAEPNVSAIALPVVVTGRGVIGSVNIVFFSTSMTPQVAARRYLEDLRGTVQAIEAELANQFIQGISLRNSYPALVQAARYKPDRRPMRERQSARG
jgi:IclR family transcriptional regulator, mhp operon transcriptional activator